jgi:polyisoprenyl-teichoic acid--peptidoglycan teichoic acid transferase
MTRGAALPHPVGGIDDGYWAAMERSPRSFVLDRLRRDGAPFAAADSRRRPDPVLARRRASTLLLLTVLIPGSAQLVAGNRSLGRIAVRVLVGAVAIALGLGALALVSRTATLTVTTHRWFLAVLEWALYGFGALWLVLLVDAWRLGRPIEQTMVTRRWLAAATVVLFGVPGSVVYAGRAVAAVRQSVGSVFSGATAHGAVQGRYNILLLGGDSGAGRVGTRPDSIQLASIDARTGRTVLFGFSRETENIRFRPGSVMAGLLPRGWTCGDECLLNGLYTWAQDHADRFPAGTDDPGVLATTEAVESLSGLEVQYHVLVDLQGFRGLVDAVGGLTITVQRRTPIGGGKTAVSEYIEPGRQTLDGYHALWYARSRTGSTNYERMARQRCVITALIAQLDPRTLVVELADLVRATAGVVRTDIPRDELPALADLAVRTKSQKLTSVNFVPPLIRPWDYDPEVVRSTVAKAVSESERAGPDQIRRRAPGRAPATAAATPPPSAPPVMTRPGTDPDARTADLGTVCAAG